jgi:hypothetical protein
MHQEAPGKTTNAPFMALVDAAASLLDEKATVVAKSKDLPEVSSGSSRCDSSTQLRPSTPSVSNESLSAASGSSSPKSVVSVTGSIEETLSDKKLSFTEQLMAILDDEEFSDVVTWMPDGKAFTIRDPKRFTKELMPKYFSIRNMSSFVRKLTRWGFARVHEKQTMNSDIFKHPEFQKGQQGKCREIKCVGRTTPPMPATMPGPRVVETVTAPLPSVSDRPSHATTRPPSTSCHAPNKPPPTAAYATLQRNPDPLLEALALRRFLEQQAMSSICSLHHRQHHQSSWLHGRPDHYYTLPGQGSLAGWATRPSTLPY